MDKRRLPHPAALVCVLLAVVVGLTGGRAATEPAGEFVACLNGAPSKQHTTYDDFVNGKPTRLVLELFAPANTGRGAPVGLSGGMGRCSRSLFALPAPSGDTGEIPPRLRVTDTKSP